MTNSKNKHGPPIKYGEHHRAGPSTNEQKWKDLHPPWQGYFQFIWPTARNGESIAGFWCLHTIANSEHDYQLVGNQNRQVGIHDQLVGTVKLCVGELTQPVGTHAQHKKNYWQWLRQITPVKMQNIKFQQLRYESDTNLETKISIM